MSKALSVGAVFLFLVLVVIGLWDLFRGLNASAALIALIFSRVFVGFNRQYVRSPHHGEVYDFFWSSR